MTAITPDTSLTKTPLLTLLSLSQQSTQLETLVTWSPVSVALDDIISKMKEIIGPEILQWGYINVRLMQGCIEKDLLPLIPFHAIIPLKISFDQRNRFWIICHVYLKGCSFPLGNVALVVLIRYSGHIGHLRHSLAGSQQLVQVHWNWPKCWN